MLVADLLLRHPHLLAGAAAGHRVVGGRRDQPGDGDVADQPGGRLRGQLERDPDRHQPAEQRHQLVHRPPDEDGDQGALDQHLAALPQGVRPEQPLGALDRVQPRPLRLERLGGDEEAALGERGGHADQQDAGAEGDHHQQRQHAAVVQQPGGVVPVGRGDGAQRPGEQLAHRLDGLAGQPVEHDSQCEHRAPRAQLRRPGDPPLLAALLELLGSRFLGLLLAAAAAHPTTSPLIRGPPSPARGSRPGARACRGVRRTTSPPPAGSGRSSPGT